MEIESARERAGNWPVTFKIQLTTKKARKETEGEKRNKIYNRVEGRQSKKPKLVLKLPAAAAACFFFFPFSYS